MFERAHRPAEIIIAEISRNLVHVDMAERDVAFEFRAPDEVRLKGAFGGRDAVRSQPSRTTPCRWGADRSS